MFGYIHPLKPEMKVKDYEKFRAYYCGVCHSISKRTGQSARLALTYDACFYAIFLDALYMDSETSFETFRCIRHPVNKRPMAVNSSCTDYAADVNVILAWYNLMDKYIDGDRAKAKTAMTVMKRGFERCRKRYSKLCDQVSKRLDDLHHLEQEKSTNIDLVSETFADIIKNIACPDFLNLTEQSKEAVQWLGYNLGKWLYLIDAFDDLEQDVEKKQYNPFLTRYGYNPDLSNMEEFKKEIRPQAEFILVNCLDQITKAYGLIDVTRNQEIIENIIYMGMLNKTDQVLQGVKKNNEKSV
ncbi:MAG TPA: hypothetical protein DDZ89_18435 [Clostridiales bacterium]|nr:hypothetical protein [Clostridiales bacterium]